MTYPKTTAGRRTARNRAQTDLVYSLKCTRGRHAGQRAGCTSDPEHCLCQCHDPAPAVA